MTIISDILSEIKTNDNHQALRELCDKIIDEEKRNITSVARKFIPDDPNIFLYTEIPNNKYIKFLYLERDFESGFVVKLVQVLRSVAIKNKDISLKLVKTWEIRLEDRPNKIIGKYFEIYKFLLGE
jgi:uncharacterized protein with ACT and thioredoxin-like domain